MFPTGLTSYLKRFGLYIFHKCKHRHLVIFDRTTFLSRRCHFEGMNKVYPHTTFCGSMGRGSYIGNNCHISADIGRFSSIGNNISQILERHPYKEPFATTSPMFYSLRRQNGHTYAQVQMFEEYRYYDKDREIAFRVGSDCWIGNGACFVGGVQIGDGAVVLAKAFVTKDVPPYAIVGGIPAKVIGYRYDEETIHFLLSFKWWNKDINWLREHWDMLCNIDALKNSIGNETPIA